MASREITRPDPEELLRHIQEQERHEGRGRLKIFLGYAPRVGKSVRMFDEGLRRKKRGQDVVIGAVQSRGSDAVESFVCQLELVPPKIVGDQETVDVAAIIARHPHVVLIDELARDNPPGSANAHRWEDVEQIRDAGINVVAALNLQHIFEHLDEVEKITGRRARNSVPESFLETADEIVIVDVPADNLTNALEQHPTLNADALTQLRELALLVVAQVVEQQLQRYMDAHGIRQSWGTQERILVCITPRSNARPMIESGARAAARFHGQLLAAWARQEGLTREADEIVQSNLDYARKLGAEVHILEGRDAIDAIVRFAQEQRVTQVYIGHSRQPAWKFWAPNPVDRLIQAAEGMDVRIFPHGQRG
jgi:two-component system sensor histidine kinase KdpD